jgi:hypothetical protein
MQIGWSCLVRSVIGVIAGAALFWLALGWAVTAAAGGHGSYLPAKLFFPWGMFVAYLFDYIGTMALAVGALQFPAYGAVLGGSPTWRCLGRRAAVVFFVHLVAAVVAANIDGPFPN